MLLLVSSRRLFSWWFERLPKAWQVRINRFLRRPHWEETEAPSGH